MLLSIVDWACMDIFGQCQVGMCVSNDFHRFY